MKELPKKISIKQAEEMYAWGEPIRSYQSGYNDAVCQIVEYFESIKSTTVDEFIDSISKEVVWGTREDESEICQRIELFISGYAKEKAWKAWKTAHCFPEETQQTILFNEWWEKNK